MNQNELNTIWEKVCNQRAEYESKYGHLEHTEEIEQMREFRNKLSDLTQEIQQEIDDAILRNHKVPNLKNAYLKKYDDGDVAYYHVKNVDECVERLFKGIRVKLQSEYVLYADGGSTLWTYVNDETSIVDFTWAELENESNNHVEFITKEEYLSVIQKELTDL